jgi:hypothetical protein
MNPAQEKKLDKVVDSLDRVAGLLVTMSGKMQVLLEWPPSSKVEPNRTAPSSRIVGESGDVHEFSDRQLEELFQQIKDRLITEAAIDPRVLEVLVQRPEIRVKVERATIEVDGDTLRGRLALLIHEGFFDESKEGGKVFAEVQRRGFKTAHPNVSRELGELSRLGFLTRSNKWYTAVPAMKANVVAEGV